MDRAKFREALGLDAEDFSDDDIDEALAEAGYIAPTTTAEPAPVAASTPTVEADAATGVIRIEASAWQETQEQIRRLQAAEQRRRNDERDQIITDAIRDGRFAPARRDHWVRLWDKDPEGTRASIASLARNLIPVMASGHASEGSVEDDELDREIERLSMPKGKVA